MNRALWIAQVLLALVFLATGISKLTLPAAELAREVPVLPAGFLRFIGACELLGALGLILPALSRVLPWLTPLAAAGLVIIMAGATVLSPRWGPLVASLFPFALGVLAVFVAYGRWRLAPIPSRSGQPRLGSPLARG